MQRNVHGRRTEFLSGGRCNAVEKTRERKEEIIEPPEEKITAVNKEKISPAGITEQLLLCFGLCAAIVAAGIFISSQIASAIHTDLKMDTLIITIITVIIANIRLGKLHFYVVLMFILAVTVKN